MLEFYDLNEVSQQYLLILSDIYDHFDHISSPRNMMIRESLDYGFRINNPESGPITTLSQDRNEKIKKYTQKEMELYLSGTDSAKDFSKASKFWLSLANPDGSVNSAYGNLIWKQNSHGNSVYEHIMRTPWEWAVDSLKQDKDTRQAILRFNLPEHAWRGNKDFPCTMHGNFNIRNNKLNFSIVMRSNDVVKGLVYDMPFFIHLMDMMIDELKDTYPDLKKGTYFHMAHSMHMYEKDVDVVKKMLRRD